MPTAKTPRPASTSWRSWKTPGRTTLTETYVVLEGEGWLELDGERIPLKALTTVKIHPGCGHRAVGKLKVLNIVLPVFDPADEWFDE